MLKLEVFFDYICPFCFKGHEYLKELIPSYPDVEIVWCPCESHPRSEERARYSDLCLQAMYFARDHGADLWKFHERMYNAAIVDRIDINSIDAIADTVKDLLDADALEKALQNGKYAKVQRDGNRYGWEQNGFEAVPSYRMGGKKLDSVLGVGVTKDQLKDFLDGSQTE